MERMLRWRIVICYRMRNDENFYSNANYGHQNIQQIMTIFSSLFEEYQKLLATGWTAPLLTHALTHWLTHSLTYSLTYSLTHLLTHSLTHLLTHSSSIYFCHIRCISKVFI